MAVDAAGNAFVADSTNRRIRKVDPDGNTTTVAGNGVASLQDGTGGPNGTAEFDFPFALILDDAGNILVVETVPDSRVRRVDGSGNVTTLPCTETEGEPFNDLLGILLDRSGDIYVSDAMNNRICQLDPLGEFGTTLAGGTQGNANGQYGAAQFKVPVGMAIDAAGNVYVADSQNSLIREIDPTGNVTTFAGDRSQSGFADGPRAGAQFDYPSGVAVDPQGNVVVADCLNNRVRLIDLNGNVTTLAGNGHKGDADGTGGASGTAEFYCPVDVAIDSACNLYVADINNHRIRKISFGVPPP